MNKHSTHPFDLERAKAGDALITVGGQSARLICSDLESTDYPLVVALRDAVGQEGIDCYTLDGLFYKSGEDNLKNLRMKARLVKGVMRVKIATEGKILAVCTDIYETKEKLLANCGEATHESNQYVEVEMYV
jgi:hypothetical protein